MGGRPGSWHSPLPGFWRSAPEGQGVQVESAMGWGAAIPWNERPSQGRARRELLVFSSGEQLRRASAQLRARRSGTSADSGASPRTALRVGSPAPPWAWDEIPPSDGSAGRSESEEQRLESGRAPSARRVLRRGPAPSWGPGMPWVKGQPQAGSRREPLVFRRVGWQHPASAGSDAWPPRERRERWEPQEWSPTWASSRTTSLALVRSVRPGGEPQRAGVQVLERKCRRAMRQTEKEFRAPSLAGPPGGAAKMGGLGEAVESNRERRWDANGGWASSRS